MSEVEMNESTTETPVADKIEVMGGELPVSFDELETIHSYHHEKAKSAKEPKQEKSEKKAEGKNSGKESGAKTGEAKKGKEAEVDEKDQDDEELVEGDSSKASAKSKEEKPQAKTIKAKAGDQELELSLATMVPAKVDGKEVEVSLEELRNNYAGKVAWSTEFSKLGTEKKKFSDERNAVNAALGEIFELSKKDGVASLMKMAELTGLDPIKWRKDFMDSLIPALESYAQMDETERKAAEAEFERNYYRGQLESQSKRQQEEQSFKQFQTHVAQLQQTHQIDPAKFEKTFFELEALQKEGSLKTEITPEFVVEIVKSERVYDAVSEVCTELNLPKEQKDMIFKDLSEIATRNPELTANDLKEIARDVWGMTKAKNLSRKMQKSGRAETVVKAKAQPKNPGHEAITFDDL